MVIDPLKEYTIEEIAALHPTMHDLVDLLKHEQDNSASYTQEQRSICTNNMVKMFKTIGKEKALEYIHETTGTKPASQQEKLSETEHEHYVMD